ncbi:MAG: TlpA family protein disulfide reductase, partial [Acidimicrobiales bacterium]
MTRRRWAVAGGVLVALVLVALALRPTGSPEVAGTRAPSFSTFDLAGRPVRSADFAGRPVLVNFWASWCVPCRREFPLLRRAEESGRVEVLGVVFQD